MTGKRQKDAEGGRQRQRDLGWREKFQNLEEEPQVPKHAAEKGMTERGKKRLALFRNGLLCFLPVVAENVAEEDSARLGTLEREGNLSIRVVLVWRESWSEA
ncbi:UNVERIFIED_CONTAM: hypothetical protein HHA_453910 [Hammondia hammondi]|eukprot:XP_008887319.1 hypothetical protein HHA_453910 [Hammondia hammondi]